MSDPRDQHENEFWTQVQDATLVVSDLEQVIDEAREASCELHAAIQEAEAAKQDLLGLIGRATGGTRSCAESVLAC